MGATQSECEREDTTFGKVNGAQPDPRHQSPTDGPKAVRFLIVDDEAPIRKELLEMFADEQLDAVEAGDANRALEMIEADPAIGVIFTDLRMPGMSGIDLVAELQQRYAGSRHFAVVVITGHGGLHDAIEALQHGVVDFVLKPFNFDRTAEAIQKGVSAWKAQTSQQRTARKLESTVTLQGLEIEKLTKDNDVKKMHLVAEERVRKRFFKDMTVPVTTPLQYMGSALKALSKDDASSNDETFRGWLKSFEEATAQLTNHVTTVLDVADVDVGGTRVKPTSFSPIEACIQAAWLFGDKANADGIEITVTGDIQDARICSDRGRFLLALGYVLDNSVRYAPRCSQVVVSLTYDRVRNNWIYVTISDDGAGMSREQIAKALAPSRGNVGSDSNGASGGGFGLYLAKHNVELNGGSLHLKNRIGGGLQVTMRFPLVLQQSGRSK